MRKASVQLSCTAELSSELSAHSSQVSMHCHIAQHPLPNRDRLVDCVGPADVKTFWVYRQPAMHSSAQ